MKMKQFKSKIVLTISLFFSALCLMTTSVQAQRSPEKLANNKVKELKTALKLQDDQIGGVKKIFVTYYTEMQATRDLKGTERQKARRAVNKATNASLQEILTPEQWKELLKIRKQKRQQKKQQGE